MSRWAAHFVIVGETIYRMHCLEIASSGDLQEIFPLTEEIAGTSFLDGVLLAVTASSVLTEKEISQLLWRKKISEYPMLLSYLRQQSFVAPALGEKIRLFHIQLHPLTASELSTNNSRSNCHIE